MTKIRWNFFKGFFVLCLLSFLFCNCASQRVWTYNAGQKTVRNPIANKSVAVTDFADERINENDNLLGLGMIPLFPFGWQTMNTPEGGQMHLASGLWLFRPPEDIGKAVAAELENSSIFKEVFYTTRKSDADLYFTGTIKSTKYTSKQFTYCISFFGVYLWFIGFPCGTNSNELTLNFKLVDNKSNTVLWEKEYTDYDSNVQWIYYIQPDFKYDGMLKNMMKKATVDLASALH